MGAPPISGANLAGLGITAGGVLLPQWGPRRSAGRTGERPAPVNRVVRAAMGAPPISGANVRRRPEGDAVTEAAMGAPPISGANAAGTAGCGGPPGSRNGGPADQRGELAAQHTEHQRPALAAMGAPPISGANDDGGCAGCVYGCRPQWGPRRSAGRTVRAGAWDGPQHAAMGAPTISGANLTSPAGTTKVLDLPQWGPRRSAGRTLLWVVLVSDHD